MAHPTGNVLELLWPVSCGKRSGGAGVPAAALKYRTASSASASDNDTSAAIEYANMPRSLARLRYRPPPNPSIFAHADPTRRYLAPLLENQVSEYVVRQSNPRHLKLQTVVNPKARRQATGVFVPAPVKPYTLRDVVDPEAKAQHGEIIYVFRNEKTNQIIYSLSELLDVWPSPPI